MQDVLLTGMSVARIMTVEQHFPASTGRSAAECTTRRKEALARTEILDARILLNECINGTKAGDTHRVPHSSPAFYYVLA